MESLDTSACACAISTVSQRTRAEDLAANRLTVLFTVCVLHWATAIDRQDRTTTSGSLRPNYISESRGVSNSTHDSKADNYLELDERYVAKLTTYIEANGEETPNSDARNSRVIEVKTQHVREVAMEPYDIESGNCRESQENIVKA